MKPVVLVVWPLMGDMLYTLDALKNVLDKKAGFLPLPVVTGAAYVPEDFGVRIIDENTEGTGWLRQSLEGVCLVVLSFMNVQHGRAVQIARQASRRGVQVAVAGTWVSRDEDWRSFPADYYLRGPAEGWAAEFFASFLSQKAARHYYACEDSRFTRYRRPRYDLLNVSDYHNAQLQSSEGCPYRCTFCSESHQVRLRPIEQVLDELECLYRQGSRAVVFADANLLVKRSRYVELMKALAGWNADHHWAVRFGGEVSLNLADDPELLQLLPEAGFQVVYLGIETLSQEGLTAIKKRHNVSRRGLSLLEMVRRFQRAGLEVTAGFINGFDHDTLDCFRATAEFIEEAGIVFTTAGSLVATAGTPLWEQFRSQNRLWLSPGGEAEEGGLDSANFGGGPNFQPARMTCRQLAQGSRWLWRRLASIPSFQRRLTGLVTNIGAGNRQLGRRVALRPYMHLVCLRAHLAYCRNQALRPAWRTALRLQLRYPGKVGVITRAMCEFLQLRASALASGADPDHVPAEPDFGDETASLAVQ